MRITAILISILSAFSAWASRPELGVGSLYIESCSPITANAALVRGVSLCVATISGDFRHRYLVLQGARGKSEVYQVEELSQVGDDVMIKIRRFNLHLLETSSEVAGRGKLTLQAREVQAVHLRMSAADTMLRSLPAVQAQDFKRD